MPCPDCGCRSQHYARITSERAPGYTWRWEECSGCGRPCNERDRQPTDPNNVTPEPAQRQGDLFS